MRPTFRGRPRSTCAPGASAVHPDRVCPAMSKVHLHGAGHGPGHQTAEGDEGDGGDTGGDGGHDDGDAPGTTRTRRRWTGRLELIITVLLGLTAVVGAFAALKNEQRNHD